MTIEKCNKYRIRMTQEMPRTCEECGLGPCRYPSGENVVANTDLSGNTPTTTIDLFSIDYSSVERRVLASFTVIAAGTATERIECGDLVRIDRDPVTGICYARKA